MNFKRINAKMGNLTKCLSTYLKLIVIASVVFQTGCATEIEWAPRNPPMREVENQSAKTNRDARGKIAAGRKQHPEFYKDLDKAISDETIVITDSYNGKVYFGR